MNRITISIFFLFAGLSFTSAQWHLEFSTGYMQYINATDFVEEISTRPTGQTRSSYNIAEGLSSIAIQAGVDYELSDRWFINLDVAYLNASGTYFEKNMLIRNGIVYSDFDADAEIRTIDLGLSAQYDVISTEAFHLGFSLGMNMVSRKHEYMNYQEYNIDDNDQLTFTVREFTTSDAISVGLQFGSQVSVPVSDRVSIIGQALGMMYFDSDSSYRFLGGVSVSL